MCMKHCSTLATVQNIQFIHIYKEKRYSFRTLYKRAINAHETYKLQYKTNKISEIDLNLKIKKPKLKFGKIKEAIYIIKFLQELNKHNYCCMAVTL